MVDPVTVVGTAGALVRAAGSDLDTQAKQARLLARVLGPPADALGESLARWTAFRTRNMGVILENADKKLGDRAEGPGGVPMRVAGEVFEAGSYCDDQMLAEYLGGVLASAKTDVGRDDRATRWVKVITSLSSYDVRLPYLLYTAARDVYLEHGMITEWGNELTYHEELPVLFDYTHVVNAMEFGNNEGWPDIMAEAMFALSAQGLITGWSYGPKDHMQGQLVGKECPYQNALHFTPTTVGVQLYMWAQGRGSNWRNFDSPEIELLRLAVPTIDGTVLVSSLPPRTFRPPDHPDVPIPTV